MVRATVTVSSAAEDPRLKLPQHRAFQRKVLDTGIRDTAKRTTHIWVYTHTL